MKLLLPPLSSSPRISLFFTWTWIICSCKIQITHNQGINLGIKEQLRWGVYGEALAIIPSPHKFQRQLHPRY
ncbi:hypothetical protein COP2_025504 [Malus domestica]